VIAWAAVFDGPSTTLPVTDGPDAADPTPTHQKAAPTKSRDESGRQQDTDLPLVIPKLRPLIDSDRLLLDQLPRLALDHGPLAVDTERADGFRYKRLPYLIQMNSPSTGTLLIDPIQLSQSALAQLNQVLADRQWVIHSASQDLVALRLVGLTPHHLFDTELAGRLLNLGHVSLGAMLEKIMQVHLAKDHGHSDWSTRPLPEDWLRYAAGDVDYLIELAANLDQSLRQSGKHDWAAQEFDWALCQPAPAAKPDPWRSTSGIGQVSHRRGLALIKDLWTRRETLAEQLDLSPHLLLTDRMIIALAELVSDAPMTRVRALLTRRDFRQPKLQPYLDHWRKAIDSVEQLPEIDLPPRRGPKRGLLSPNRWEAHHPEAYQRWLQARQATRDLATKIQIPVENLISPKPLQQLAWQPTGPTATQLDDQLAQYCVRSWQRQLVLPVIVKAWANSPRLGPPADDQPVPQR
jgi:ribonuclease D